MVHISEGCMDIVRSSGGGVFEISAMPDSGLTTAAFSLLGKAIEEKSGQNPLYCGYYFTHTVNKPDPGYLISILPPDISDRVVMCFYDETGTATVMNFLNTLADRGGVYIIDDFYSLVLYKNYTLIRDFAKQLKEFAETHDARIFICNQLRHVVKSQELEFSQDSPLKALYHEHLNPFTAGRLSVHKKNGNIFMDVLDMKPPPVKTLLDELLR